ncbi:MAG: hypothetical protein OSA77_02305 [Halioglobus sp.]|nr:hypothetical protein [Halioglobus sp.]
MLLAGAGTRAPLESLMLSVDLWVRRGEPNELDRRIKKGHNVAVAAFTIPVYRL